MRTPMRKSTSATSPLISNAAVAGLQPAAYRTAIAQMTVPVIATMMKITSMKMTRLKRGIRMMMPMTIRTKTTTTTTEMTMMTKMTMMTMMTIDNDENDDDWDDD